MSLNAKKRLWKCSRLKATKETRQVDSLPDPRLDPILQGQSDINGVTVSLNGIGIQMADQYQC